MPAEEGDFRANPVWYAVARGENGPLVKFLVKRGRISFGVDSHGSTSFIGTSAAFRCWPRTARGALR
jgi:hypothetical protein